MKMRPNQNLVFDTSDLVLTVLRDAARLAPIPYLQDAAGLALSIVQIIQAAKDNKDAFRCLANDACGLVYTILSKHTTPENALKNVSKETLENLQELTKMLTSVEHFTKSAVSRNFVIRLLKRKADIIKIQKFRETLRQHLDPFGLDSTVTIKEHVENIIAEEGGILQAFRSRNSAAANNQSKQEAPHSVEQSRSTSSNAERLERDTSDLVLTVLRSASHLAPMSYLQDAAGLALGVVNLSKAVQDNKDAFQSLVNDMCGLVYAILVRHTTPGNTPKNVSKKILVNLQELLKTLASIKGFARSQISRNIFTRLIKRKANFRTIQEFRETLKHSLAFFGLNSTVTIQEHVNNTIAGQGEIFQAFRSRNAVAVNDQRKQEALHNVEHNQCDDSIREPYPDGPKSSSSSTSVGRDQNFIDSSLNVSNKNSGNTTITHHLYPNSSPLYLYHMTVTLPESTHAQVDAP